MARDKAWFFLARGETTTNQIDQTLDGQLFNNSSELFASIAKINFQPGVNHSLSYTYIDAPIDRIFLLPADGRSLQRDVLRSFRRHQLAELELVGEPELLPRDEDRPAGLRRKPAPPLRPRRQGAGSELPAPDPALGRFAPNNNDNAFVQNFDNTWHNGWIFQDGYGLNEFPREQFNIAATQFVGNNHEFKYGLDLQRGQVGPERAAAEHPDGLRLPFSALLTAQPTTALAFAADPTAERRRHALLPGRLQQRTACRCRTRRPTGKNYGAYVRDRITVGDQWTFNVGLRAEQQNLANDTGRDVIDQLTFSPRFNAVYDVKGDGRQLVTFNTGRFFVQTPQYLANSALQEGWNGASNAYDLFLHSNSFQPGLRRGCPPAVRPEDFACGFLAGLGLPAGGLHSARRILLSQLGSVRPGGLFDLVDQGRGTVWTSSPTIATSSCWALSGSSPTTGPSTPRASTGEVDDLIGTTLQRDPNGTLYQLVANYGDYAEHPALDSNFVGNFLATNANFTFNGEGPTAAMAEAHHQRLRR